MPWRRPPRASCWWTAGSGLFLIACRHLKLTHSVAHPAAPPALVIADYRLDNGETGVAAIDLVRERFGRGVPAIVVTGSSMTGHDKEALEHDFHLLIKPVLPNKLRAMIAFKLGRR